MPTKYTFQRCIDYVGSARRSSDNLGIDDLELYKFEFSENFAGFRRFRTQQQLNE